MSTKKITRKALKRFNEINETIRALNAEKAALVELFREHYVNGVSEIKFSDIKLNMSDNTALYFDADKFKADHLDLYESYKTKEVYRFTPKIKAA